MMSVQLRLVPIRLLKLHQGNTRMCMTWAENAGEDAQTADTHAAIREMGLQFNQMKANLAQSSNLWMQNLLQFEVKENVNNFELCVNRLTQLNKKLADRALTPFNFESAAVLAVSDVDNVNKQDSFDEKQPLCLASDILTDKTQGLTCSTNPYIRAYSYTADDIFTHAEQFKTVACTGLVENPQNPLSPNKCASKLEIKNILGNEHKPFGNEVLCNIEDVHNHQRKVLTGSSWECLNANVMNCLKDTDINSILLTSETGSSKAGPPSSPDPNKPSEEQLMVIKNHLIEKIPKFFVDRLETRGHHKDVLFENNVATKPYKINGISSYAMDLLKIRIYYHMQYANVRAHVMKVTHHLDEGVVRVHWRISGIPQAQAFFKFWKFLPWTYRRKLNEDSQWIDGISTFYVDSNGLIFKHQADRVMPDVGKEEAKDDSLVKKLQEVLTPKTAVGAS